MTHVVGEVQPLLERIVNHYPNVREAMRFTGISKETYHRIMRRAPMEPLSGPVCDKITAAVKNLTGPPMRKIDPGSWEEAAEYAKTPEGRAFIAECRGAA